MVRSSNFCSFLNLATHVTFPEGTIHPILGIGNAELILNAQCKRFKLYPEEKYVLVIHYEQNGQQNHYAHCRIYHYVYAKYACLKTINGESLSYEESKED